MRLFRSLPRPSQAIMGSASDRILSRPAPRLWFPRPVISNVRRLEFPRLREALRVKPVKIVRQAPTRKGSRPNDEELAVRSPSRPYVRLKSSQVVDLLCRSLRAFLAVETPDPDKSLGAPRRFSARRLAECLVGTLLRALRLRWGLRWLLRPALFGFRRSRLWLCSRRCDRWRHARARGNLEREIGWLRRRQRCGRRNRRGGATNLRGAGAAEHEQHRRSREHSPQQGRHSLGRLRHRTRNSRSSGRRCPRGVHGCNRSRRSRR